MLSLPAGSYYLRRLDMVFENTMSLRFPQPEELLVFKKNSIHYLGELSWKRRLVYLNFSKEVVIQAMEDNPSVFKARDVYVLNHLFGDPSIDFVRPPGVPRA